LFLIFIDYSGYVHFSQRMYFSINLSRYVLIYGSVNEPFMMYSISFPFPLTVVYDPSSYPRNFKIYSGGTLRALATS